MVGNSRIAIETGIKAMNKPPKIALRILEYLSDDRFYIAASGDCEEIYNDKHA